MHEQLRGSYFPWPGSGRVQIKSSRLMLASLVECGTPRLVVSGPGACAWLEVPHLSMLVLSASAVFRFAVLAITLALLCIPLSVLPF